VIIESQAMDNFEFAPPPPPWEPEPEPLELSPSSQDREEKSSLPGVLKGSKEEPGLNVPTIEEPEPTEPGPEVFIPPQLYNGKPVEDRYAEESEDRNGDELDGFFFYRIKAPQGITLNGTHYPPGAYWFNQATYGGIEAIDAPFQG